MFYLKLLLESIDHEGSLRFSDTIPYNEQMLSVITNTNVDIVRSAMKIFVELQLIEIFDDQTIFMGEIEKMIGSESESAERVRRLRQRNKALLCNGDVQKSNIEKEEEIKKEETVDTAAQSAGAQENAEKSAEQGAQEGAEQAESAGEQETKEQEAAQPSVEEQLTAKLAETNDKYIRLAAEFDNYRRRVAKEKLDLISTAGEDVIKGLLPVLDDCERALQVLDASTDSEAAKAAKEGTELIYNKLMGYLKKVSSLI